MAIENDGDSRWRQLSDGINDLKLVMTALKTRIDEVLPTIQGQNQQTTHGLMTVENRQTSTEVRVQRLEDTVTNMQKQMDRDREDAQKRTDGTYRLIATVATITGLLFAIAAFFITNVRLK